jgi:predicted enzyme related to lactoylglutathione lyase
MSAPVPRGRFVWADLMTTDTQRAIDFYTKLIGWAVTPFEASPIPYSMWTVNGSPIGGSAVLEPESVAAGVPPHWLAYVCVPDVDATTKDVERLAGRVLVPPRDIPTVGRFAVYTDPWGAVFAAFTPLNEAPGHDDEPRAGEFDWHELAAGDHAKAFTFYSTLFGWEKMDAHDMGPMGIYQLYGRLGRALGGMFDKPPRIPGPPSWLHYVRVKDVDATAKVIPMLGGKVLNGPMEVPGGSRIVQALDPQGAAFALHAVPNT